MTHVNIKLQRTFITILISFAFLIAGCKKNEPLATSPDPTGTNNAPGQFTISLEACSSDTAKIIWTDAIDPDNDVVGYKIFLNDTLKVQNFKGLNYTFRNLTQLTSYRVKIVAVDSKQKETTSGSIFVTSKYWLKFLRKVEYGAITGYSAQKIGQMVKANDGGYIIVGDSQLGDWPYGIINIFTMKLDSLGNKVWQKRYDFDSGNSDNVKIVTCKDGYVICGDRNLIKIDNNGDIMWHRDYLLTGNMIGIDVAADGSIYTTGFAVIIVGSTVGATLDKYDQFGNLIWRKSFSRTTREELHEVKVFSNDEIIVAGMSGEPDSDFWVLKVNSDGNILWEKNYHDDGVAFLKNIIKTREGNYVFTGFSLGAYWVPYFRLQMIDASGNSMWAYYSNDNNTKGYSVAESNDNALIVTGGYQDPYITRSALYKFDKNGNKLWEKLYQEFPTFLNNKTVIATNDGGFLISSQKSKAYNTYPETDQIYIFKTDDKGEFN